MRSLATGESKKRYFRCPDSLWQQFKKKCGDRKSSTVLRQLISDYLQEGTQ